MYVGQAHILSDWSQISPSVKLQAVVQGCPQWWRVTPRTIPSVCISMVSAGFEQVLCTALFRIVWPLPKLFKAFITVYELLLHFQRILGDFSFIFIRLKPQSNWTNNSTKTLMVSRFFRVIRRFLFVLYRRRVFSQPLSHLCYRLL